MGIVFFNKIKKLKVVGGMALGNFDGVHKGHQALLDLTVAKSRERGQPSAVWTFSPHPKEYFSLKSQSKNTFQKIFPNSMNYNLILNRGVKHIFIKEFNDEFSEKSPREFFNILLEKINFSFLVVGFDFRFGKERDGSIETLRELCKEKGKELHVVSPLEYHGEKISSTYVKETLKLKNLSKVRELLGRKILIPGRIKKDQGVGTQLGFPTLNFKLEGPLAFPRGVYFSKIKIGENVFLSISNLGIRPTVSISQERLTLETHILESSFSGELTSSEVSVELLQYHRPEKHFESLEKLKTQISNDVLKAKEFFDL